MIRTVLIGATGRMGLNILALLPHFPALQLCGAVASEHSAAIGKDASTRAGGPPSGVTVSSALPPLLRDADLIADAREEAQAVIAADPTLSGFPLLAAQVASLVGADRSEFLEKA